MIAQRSAALQLYVGITTENSGFRDATIGKVFALRASQESMVKTDYRDLFCSKRAEFFPADLAKPDSSDVRSKAIGNDAGRRFGVPR